MWSRCGYSSSPSPAASWARTTAANNSDSIPTIVNSRSGGAIGPMTELEGAEAQALLTRRQQTQIIPENEKREVFDRIMRVSLCTKEAFPPHVWEDSKINFPLRTSTPSSQRIPPYKGSDDTSNTQRTAFARVGFRCWCRDRARNLAPSIKHAR